MSRFGDDLRQERVSRGITLESISAKTKVIVRYLVALEDEHFEVLPGGILSKGIVRGYARTVGLDESAWVERFLAATREHGAPQDQDNWVEFASNVSRARGRQQRSSARLRWTGVAVLLALLAVFGWFVWSYVSGRVMAQEMPHTPAVSAAMTTAGNSSQ